MYFSEIIANLLIQLVECVLVNARTVLFISEMNELKSRFDG